MAREIPLTQGQVTQVDDADYEWLSKIHWKARQTSGGRWRAHINSDMARVILQAPLALHVDHINGDALDNRRANLRVCTSQHNHWNQAGSLNATTRFIGVSWDKRTRSWMASIKHKGRAYYLGRFKSEINAAHARDRAASEFRGEYARLNFPGDPLSDWRSRP